MYLRGDGMHGLEYIAHTLIREVMALGQILS